MRCRWSSGTPSNSCPFHHRISLNLSSGQNRYLPKERSRGTTMKCRPPSPHPKNISDAGGYQQRARYHAFRQDNVNKITGPLPRHAGPPSDEKPNLVAKDLKECARCSASWRGWDMARAYLTPALSQPKNVPLGVLVLAVRSPNIPGFRTGEIEVFLEERSIYLPRCSFPRKT